MVIPAVGTISWPLKLMVFPRGGNDGMCEIDTAGWIQSV